MKKLIFLFLILLPLTLGAAQKDPVYVVSLDGDVINPVSTEYISDAIVKAEEVGASALIIELDTPGGLLTSTREIVKKMMNAFIPIVVYVSPSGARAGSAGVFITLAANIAAMAPATNIGAAHPVTISGKKSIGDQVEDIYRKLTKDKSKREEPVDIMSQKILNDTKAWVSTIAKSRGRNVKWAIKSVTESSSIDETEALKLGVVSFIAEDLDDLLEKIDGRTVKIDGERRVVNVKGAPIIRLNKTVRQKILSVLTLPNIAYILMMLGFYGLLFEFTNPGIGFPGIAGVMAIIVALYGMHLLDANYAGIALIVLAIILFIMEIKIISYGLLTLGGVISLFIGSLMLFDSPYEFMRVSLPLIFAFTIATLIVATLLATMVFRVHKRKAVTGREGLLGTECQVVKWKRGRGKVFVHGEYWNAQSDESFHKNEKAIVEDVLGIKLIIKKSH